jgi:hypothetical protein
MNRNPDVNRIGFILWIHIQLLTYCKSNHVDSRIYVSVYLWNAILLVPAVPVMIHLIRRRAGGIGDLIN